MSLERCCYFHSAIAYLEPGTICSFAVWTSNRQAGVGGTSQRCKLIETSQIFVKKKKLFHSFNDTSATAWTSSHSAISFFKSLNFKSICGPSYQNNDLCFQKKKSIKLTCIFPLLTLLPQIMLYQWIISSTYYYLNTATYITYSSLCVSHVNICTCCET